MTVTTADRLGVPNGARAAARVLLLSPDSRLLLLRGIDRLSGHSWWVTPGGGVEPTETFETAAARELLEETGLSSPIGPWVWVRNHEHVFEGRPFHQHERFFVVRTTESRLEAPPAPDGYVMESRWWSLDEIQHSNESFAPARLGDFLVPILRGECPEEPIDVGI